MPDFKEIHKFTRSAGYAVDVPWDDLERHLERYLSEYRFQMEPDFQRGHVWTEEQQIAYVEFILQGGQSGRDILCNHPGWMRSFEGPFVLVDGLQRITAVLRFLHGEIPAFGHKFSEWEGHFPWECRFKFHVNDLPGKKEVLTWYLELNSGGTPHTAKELDRVRTLLQKTE